jgi:hypothetical protein
VLERRYFLERFLRKLGKYDFLLRSEEFKVFSRPFGDIEKILQGKKKLNSEEIIQRITETIHINRSNYDFVQLDKFANDIKDVIAFSNKIIP